MKLVLSLMLGCVFGAARPNWDLFDWKKLKSDLKEESSAITSAQYMIGEEFSPTGDEVKQTIRRLREALRGKELLCAKLDSKSGLSIQVVTTQEGDVLRLQSNYGYSSPTISELTVNATLTSFYFGEEPNDVVLFNTDLDWNQKAAGHPKSCDGFSDAAFLATGDIGIGHWGVKSEKGACCVLK